MKKLKCGLTLFMAVIMLLSVFSFGVSAADDKLVDTVELSVSVKPGDKFEDWSEHVTVETEGVRFAQAMEDFAVIVVGETESFYGTYNMGETYTFIFCLETIEGYYFPENAEDMKSVTVNGVAASDIMIENVNVLTVSVSVMGFTYELALGGTVEAVDAELNVYGDMSVSDWYRFLKINSQGICAPEGEFGAVRAYDKNGDPVIGEFVSGEEYRIELYLSTKKNCMLKKDDGGAVALDGVKLNGNEVDYSTGTYTQDGVSYEYIKIETTVTAKEPKYITSVDITISENLAGMPVSMWENYVTINTPGLEFLEDEYYYSVEAYDYFGNFVYDSFEEGNIYNIFVYLTTEEGYFFPQDECIEDVKINGVQIDDSDYYFYEDYESGEVYMEIYTQVDMIGDGVWAQIMFFFKKLVNWFQNMFFGILLF